MLSALGLGEGWETMARSGGGPSLTPMFLMKGPQAVLLTDLS